MDGTRGQYVYDHAQVQPTGLSGPGVEKAKRMGGLGCSGPCRQGATAADQAHLQARRRAIGEITGPGAANAEPQWRRALQHRGDHGDLRAGGHGAIWGCLD